MSNIIMRKITMRNTVRTIRNRLPYVEVSRGGYGRFRGVSFAVGIRRVFRAEIHVYRREFSRYGIRRLFGGYTNFEKMG